LLGRDLATGAPKPVYVITGDDEHGRSWALSRLKGLVDPEDAGFNLHLFREGRLALPDLLDLCRTFPMFGGQRVIVLGDLRMLDVDKEELPLLRSYLEESSPGTVIAAVAAKVDLRKEPDRSLCRLGALLEFHRPREWEMAGWIRARAEEGGLSLSARASEALALIVGTDTSRAVGELEKLALYRAGRGGAVDLQELDAVVGPGRATGLFELDDALLGRETDRAISVVRRQVRLEGSARGAFPSLLFQTGRTVRNLLRARRAADAGHRSEAALSERLEVHPYVAGKLLSALPRFRGVSLDRVLRELHAADAAAKTSHPHLEAVLDRVVLRVTGSAPGSGRWEGV
jgi:DNA polymerase-3 subunit delta